VVILKKGRFLDFENLRLTPATQYDSEDL